ncbi:cobalt-precorrin-4/precorrin-4 C(11)-methyltransferase [Halorhabdus rudnickae]|uniref:cobalt-precorrin-4/precorrin-4 C(11)-methyltransferase n=1 Tax=Halorhabdus rudnickae TaxID=1775544 RepID=UPI001083413B|nr:SAM-dependent methyltransferase [Halorhabdus rudnickae]
MSGLPWAESDAIPFVGAGPGHPKLVTVAGRKALEEADLVVHAGSLVNSEILDAYAPEADRIDSAGTDLETLVSEMTHAYEDGLNVVRLHSGDPAIFGAALEQIDMLAERGVPAYVIPGVTAAFAASATLGTQLTLPNVANHVAFTRPQGRTLDASDEHVSEFVEMGDVTTAVYLGTHAIDATMDRLLEAGVDAETPVAVIYHASWPDEDVLLGTVGDIAGKVETAGYESSALVIVGEAVTGGEYERSFLYDGWADEEDGTTESDRS